MSKRGNKRGSSTADPFAMVPRWMMSHPAVTSLNSGAFRVLVAYIAQYKGEGTNGYVGLTQQQAKLWGISKDVLVAGREKLVEHGLLVQTRPASMHPPRPALFKLTWHPCGTAPATKEYAKWADAAGKEIPEAAMSEDDKRRRHNQLEQAERERELQELTERGRREGEEAAHEGRAINPYRLLKGIKNETIKAAWDEGYSTGLEKSRSGKLAASVAENPLRSNANGTVTQRKTRRSRSGKAATL